MLSKSQRLSAEEVREVLKNGRSIREGAVSVRYTKAASGKAAVVVSTKVAKKATERNTLRRAGYAALHTLPPRTHLVVFIQSKQINPRDIALLCSKLS